MKRFGWLAILALVAGAARAESARFFNVDCEIGWQGCYRALQWTPVEITIAGGMKAPFEGVLSVTADQDEQSTMTIVHRFVLTPDVPLAVPLVAKLPYGVSQCRATIQDSRGKTAWEQTYELWGTAGGRRPLTAVGLTDTLIGVSGRAEFGLRSLARAARSRRLLGRAAAALSSVDPGDAVGKVHVAERLQRRLPWDWTAYEGLDLLVLYDVDWAALTTPQTAAIVQWVSGGGRLLVILGARPLPAGHPLAKLLPVEIGDARRLTLPPEALRAWGCDERAGGPVAVWTLAEPRAWGWKAEARGTSQPVYVHGPVGFGRAGVLAFDPSALGGAQGANLAPFWVVHLDPLLEGRTLRVAAGEKDEDNSYPADESAEGSNAVLNYLLDIPEMRPISLVWVLALLLGLAVVIGPVDYFVLKRRDRLPLTWLTFTLTIGVFSVLAFSGVKALRGGKTQFRALSVVDGVAGQAGARRCSYGGIFAPESGDYRLSGLERGQWWSAFSPSSGMYGYAGGRMGTRRITCAQEDGGSLPTYLPINIWSMQCLLTESALPEMPIAAEVERDGDDVRATITNLSDAPVARGSIRFEDNLVVVVGPIPARQTVRVEGHVVQGTPWKTVLDASDEDDLEFFPSLQPRKKFSSEAAFLARGSLRRSRTILDRLAVGAAVVCVEYEAAPLPYGLADRSCRTTHTQWARLLVVPRKGRAP